MSWEQVAVLKLSLWEWWQTQQGANYAEGFYRSLVLSHSVYERGKPNPLYSNLDVVEPMNLHQAEPIYVSPEIMDIAETAAETFQPEPFLPSDLITNRGFLLLPRSMTYHDSQGKRVSFKACCWMPGSPGSGMPENGIWLSFYSYKPDVIKLEEEYGADLSEARFPEWMFLGATPWLFNQGVEEMIERLLVDNDEQYGWESTMEWWRFMQTLFRLSLQQLAERKQHTNSRPTRRRYQRAKMDRDYTTVITLRRKKGHYEPKNGEPVNWSHRWIVGGHWRNQWFPSLKTHRQIWINEYVKGPEHKPLVVRKGRAFNFVR